MRFAYTGLPFGHLQDSQFNEKGLRPGISVYKKLSLDERGIKVAVSVAIQYILTKLLKLSA